MFPAKSGHKRILFAHYRVGMTDGVSLEIAKRQHILRNQGFSVATLAGPGSSGADYVLPSMDFNTPIARKIADNAFGEITDYPDEQSLMIDIEVLSAEVEAELDYTVVPIKKLASVQLVTALYAMDHVQHSPEFAAK